MARLLADHVVPSVDGQLTGDDGGLAAIAFIDDLHEVAALRGGQLLGSPVVEEQHIGAGDLSKQPVIAAISARGRQIGQ